MFIKFLPIIILCLVTGCASTLDRLEAAGKPPALEKVNNPTEQPNYKPVTWPMPEQPAPAAQSSGSLWQQGARHFFRDQRAGRVGDIVRVKIMIQDKAELDNESTRERKNTEELKTPDILGLESTIYKVLPGGQNPLKILDIDGSTKQEGTGTIGRKEKIETQIAALITQVLPNGNMVIQGTQEIRINFEIREISVAGVIRPEDINADNTIDSSQIAQARISYGGRGQITDVQQPRWGNQVIDILSPF